MKYWALKTRKSRNREVVTDHWKDFKAESVIAIGWEKIDADPATANIEEIAAAVKKAYDISDKASTTSANTVRRFISISPGDRVLICQGYAPIQYKKVHLYGIAQVTGPFEDHDSKM